MGGKWTEENGRLRVNRRRQRRIGGEIRVGKLKSSQRMFQERMDFSRWIDAGKLLRSGHGVTSERCGRRLGRLRRERRRKVERKVRRLRLQRSSRRREVVESEKTRERTFS